MHVAILEEYVWLAVFWGMVRVDWGSARGKNWLKARADLDRGEERYFIVHIL